MKEGVAALLMSSPICKEATLLILSSLERPVGESATRRATPVQHLPPPLPGRAVEDFKCRAVLGPQLDASGPAEPCQEHFWIKRT